MQPSQRLRSLDENGRIRNFEHEIHGAEIAGQRAAALHLSNDEVERLKTIVLGHMRPLHLVNLPEFASPKAIYRFFRGLGAAGIDICLLSMADTLATYGPALPDTLWVKTLETIRSLFNAYWESPVISVAPPPLLNGNDFNDCFSFESRPNNWQVIRRYP